MPSSSAKPAPERSGTEPVCWVCLEGGDSGELLHENGELHSGGCACRGAAGFAHLPCLMKMAQANPARWTTCPTCTQPWTGSTSLCLALSRHRLAAELDDEPEHFNASWQLIDALRDSDMRFSTISPAARSGLAEMRPRVTPETLATALAPAVEDAAARGITHLSLSLIAPVTPRTAVALADPCTDQRFATLARDLARPGGPEISVTVFPLVRLRDGDSPALDALQPLSFDPDAPTRPGGLTRCRGGDDALTTYPFFIEPWRPDSDIAGRYAAALADRLALHLSTQLTEDKARP